MQSLVYMMQYGEDKKLRRMKWILLSLVSFSSYLGGMIAFTMLSVILPAFMMLAVCRLFGAQIGFSLPVYAGLLFVLALFVIAFALFLNTLFAQKVTANMLGSALAVLASIISGGFYEVAHGGGILDTIASMLLTKAVLQLSESLEAGLTAQAVWVLFCCGQVPCLLRHSLCSGCIKQPQIDSLMTLRLNLLFSCNSIELQATCEKITKALYLCGLLYKHIQYCYLH